MIGWLGEPDIPMIDFDIRAGQEELGGLGFLGAGGHGGVRDFKCTQLGLGVV